MKDKVTDKLKEAGFDSASKSISKIDRGKKAYEKYGVITQEQLDRFADKVKEQSMIETKSHYNYKRLDLIPLSEYEEVPPEKCLDAIIDAKKTGLFDTFELARLQWVNEEKVPDPIVFGCIDGITDKFFITQWDKDISIEEILES